MNGKNNNTMKNLHALRIKLYPPTKNNGATVKIISKHFKQRITINFDYSFHSPSAVAINYLTKKGFNIVAKAKFGESDIILSDTFKPLK